MKKTIRQIGSLVGLLLFGIAVWVLYDELKHYHYHDILKELRSLPRPSIAAALFITLINYYSFALFAGFYRPVTLSGGLLKRLRQKEAHQTPFSGRKNLGNFRR